MLYILFEYDLEIIQPLYNPEKNWVEKYLADYEELIKLFPGKNVRIILVNDGSLQNFTKVNIQQLEENIKSIKIVSYIHNKGKGFALRAGMMETISQNILYTDYDFPYTLTCLINAYQKLKEGNDVVIGIRNEDYYKKLSFVRTVISKSFNLFNKIILKISYPDTQSGLKAFSLKGKELLLQTKINRFLFDTEFICKAQQNKNIKIAMVNIDLNKNVKFTTISPLIILHEIKNIFSISWRLLTGNL